MYIETPLLQTILPTVTLFVGIVLLFFVMKYVLIARIVRITKRTKSHWDDALVAALQSIHPSMYVTIAVLIVLQTLDVSQKVHTIGIIIFALVATHYTVQIIGVGVKHVGRRLHGNDASIGNDGYHAQAAVELIASIAKLLIWAGSILFIVSNLGVDITSLIAGLGIGGIAIAFALQGILKDLFASFSIFFDKPFTIGDFIEVGDQSGTVQKIGIKTTRLKALSGEEIIIPNQELTSANVHNFKWMRERRIVQKIGVTYETPRGTLLEITEMIENVIGDIDGVRFSRAHFRSFDDWSLTFEVVYFVESRDYGQYMDVRQAINFGIMKIFAQNDIDIAYPTQMVYHKNK